MPLDDDGNASSSDTHALVVAHDDRPSKKIEEVAVVNKIENESPTFGSDPPKDVPTVAESSTGPSVGMVNDHQSDAGSVHSMPVVRVTESPVPMLHEPQSAAPSPSPSALSHRPPPSPSRSQTLQEPTGNNQQLQQRRASRRSTIEGRSANRLSGFFTNFMHRRDPGSSAPSPIPESATPASQSQVNSARVSESASRPTSPPPPRPATPPPSLPPPTLSELGLNLSILTSDLSPSHFSTPPTSGAFLAPHFLLLCHAQGLDVLPLISPPAPQPFKSVVVMEQRGVLVAIAGRRDGVRVYALEEVKKAIEWRIEVEVKRERERLRRENMKKSSTIRSLDGVDLRDAAEKTRKASLSTPPPGEVERPRGNLLRKSSYGPIHLPDTPPPVPLIPRPPISRPPGKKPRSASTPKPPTQPLSQPTGQPPPYASTEGSNPLPPLRTQPSAVSLRTRRGRNLSVTNVLTGVPIPRPARESSTSRPDESKADWAESSDDEAINIVAAGSSGSQALDERTSASLSANRSSLGNPMQPLVAQAAPTHTRNRSGTLRRNRPSNLDLSLVSSTPSVPPPEPSPVPTLVTLRQALANSPSSMHPREGLPEANTPAPEDEEDDEVDGQISLAQALMESRLPELPPPGTTQAQQPILLSPTQAGDGVSPRPGTPDSSRSNLQHADTGSRRRRRRWSVLLTGGSAQDVNEPQQEPPQTAPAVERSPHRFTRSYSFRSNHSQPGSVASTYDVPPSAFQPPSTYSLPGDHPPPPSSRSSRFLPRIISNAFQARRSEGRAPLPEHLSDSEAIKVVPNQAAAQSPPPKLEYVKLPGTKNALLIKAVETAKKSFLAILCGDNGEKVELFAGTYRTALGLSRTFILPDSPRSLELQLQGDDLVEVFLVFAQNVFGLEPATVRVREVRIGRAERRAARRRAREARAGESSQGQNDNDVGEDDTNVNVNIGVTVAVGDNIVATGDGTQPPTPTLVASEHPGSQPEQPSTPTESAPTLSITNPEDLLAVASSQTGPYTTFQQLTIVTKHEPGQPGQDSLPSMIEAPAVQFSPPGLPVPAPTAPPKWLYRDPKGVVHGPWKASLMQVWYKDGLLPPDLPVRREEDEEFTLLKELRLQSVDPTQPFRSPPVTSPPQVSAPEEAYKPLLAPISLLSQPRHFGPPALFFSSRGGHSTAIVDSRRFHWSCDHDESEDAKVVSTMGDIRRLEAFDVDDRSVLVAMRQGGLEAVDFNDALLKPADESRTALPHYNPPPSTTNRRPPFVWKIGTPIQASPTPLNALTHKSKGSGFSHHLSSKRPGSASSKGYGKTDPTSNEADLGPEDEVFYVGRKEDELYVCERNAGSFRILKLSPNVTV
ncbi:hypothetical protein DFP72DRAFT_866240 [Ephemerocybe angulata]|uniref:GYF domain-containing protein n=1 Tax=Ephemerocybe angulata TaxID=980116 RepID=A0A8H6IIV1_9AGAR|nr:hypothetical protein DFP72DRAFT_866240 [Tulosesus angulatus]